MQVPSSVLKVLLGIGFAAVVTTAVVWSSRSAEHSVAHQTAHLRAITVQVLSGNRGIGSGTLIAVERGVYRVITNQHVLPQKTRSLAVQTADLKIHPVQVVQLASSNSTELDLAILEFQAVDDIYVTAVWAKEMPKIGDELVAAGFPAVDRSSPPHQSPTIERGTISYLASRPLTAGYQIGHRANVRKGMSGGPALNSRGELAGINGIHAQPLWNTIETYADGTEVEEPLQSAIPAFSWAIPVQRLADLGIKP